MKLSELLSGRSDFASKLSVIEFTRKSNKFRPNLERLEDADALLIFSTSKQQTWLIATNARLYCVLDDIRRDEPNVNWSIPRSMIFDGSKYILRPKMSDGESPLTGTISFSGVKRPWLYSKRLFSRESIDVQLQKLLESTMLPAEVRVAHDTKLAE